MTSFYYNIALTISSITHHWNIILPRTNTSSCASSSNIVYSIIDLFIVPIILSIFLILHHGITNTTIHAIAIFIIPLLRPLTILLQISWPRLLPRKLKLNNIIIKYIIHGGPLGKNCNKLCEVVCAYILMYYKYHPTQTHLDFQRMNVVLLLAYSWKAWTIFIFFMITTNMVLSIWSNSLTSVGNHNGVNTMIKSSISRSLTCNEHIGLLVVAIINAYCEEITSRGFFMYEFIQYFKSNDNDNDHNSFFIKANLCQAISFGIWHYHGIPSGYLGVLLTFVYGYIMGELKRYHNDGLVLPIIAHSVADYFIFSVIVRRHIKQNQMIQ